MHDEYTTSTTASTRTTAIPKPVGTSPPRHGSAPSTLRRLRWRTDTAYVRLFPKLTARRFGSHQLRRADPVSRNMALLGCWFLQPIEAGRDCLQSFGVMA